MLIDDFFLPSYSLLVEEFGGEVRVDRQRPEHKKLVYLDAMNRE